MFLGSESIMNHDSFGTSSESVKRPAKSNRFELPWFSRHQRKQRHQRGRRALLRHAEKRWVSASDQLDLLGVYFVQKLPSLIGITITIDVWVFIRNEIRQGGPLLVISRVISYNPYKWPYIWVNGMHLWPVGARPPCILLVWGYEISPYGNHVQIQHFMGQLSLL